MPKPTIPTADHKMPPMLALTIRSSMSTGYAPSVVIGYGKDGASFKPQNPADDSYWFLILDATNPRNKVKEFVAPGSQNSTVPAGLDNYMSSPQYVFVLATQFLNMMHVPQGPLYDYLIRYGANRELQRMEQINSVLSCGSFSRLSYILTGQCGSRDIDPITKIKPVYPAYEKSTTSSTNGELSMLMLSLMARGADNSGNPIPPYAVCDSYSFRH